ncbi:MAG: ShlB/FhaC/HecB family hemolysin secretion/activation protein [Pseudomonadales bacterium]|nr:ShlB/FhaC/HecB family hemolysin secretion/activation protein [Pseudomonadales bacterium]
MKIALMDMLLTHYKSMLFGLIFCCLSLVSIAQPSVPNLLQPERELPLLPEAVVDEIVSVPAIGVKPVEDDGGTTITIQQFVISYDQPEALTATQLAGAQQLTVDFLAQHQQQLNLAQLDDLVFSLTQYLRDNGFMLAQALLPAQEIERGEVSLQVLIGMLGDVVVENNLHYRAEVLSQPFQSAMGKPVKVSIIESQILRLNDLPGLSATAVFKAGDDLGETRMAVKVLEEDRLEYLIKADNYGADISGVARLWMGVTAKNLSGHRDILSVDTLKTFDSGDMRNARITYEITEPSVLHTFGTSFSKTRLDIQGPLTNNGAVEVDTEIGKMYVRSQWFKSRDLTVSTQLGLAVKRSNIIIDQFNSDQGVDRLAIADAVLVAEGVDKRFKGIYRASLSVSQGLNNSFGAMNSSGNNDSLTKAIDGTNTLSGEFTKYNASYTRLQTLSRNQSLLFHVHGQYTKDRLSTLEKISLGGPYSVRAYSVAEYARDTAVLASLAWQTNGGALLDSVAYDDYTWNEIVQLSVFADYAVAKAGQKKNGDDQKEELSGWGVEARFTFPEPEIFASIALARPFDGAESLSGDNGQYWLVLGMIF